TGCTPQHKDYFTGGADTAMQVIKKDRMGEYMGAEKARSVADTLRYKGAHPYAEGARLEKEVLSGLSDSEVQKLYKELAAEFPVDYDEAGSIGKRYRREDEIGTPFCITVDFQTVGDENNPADNCVTIRERDSMEQVRIPIEEVKNYIAERIRF
ncbi:MAG: hypothetical protein IKX92_05435, partial [Clostridia bacterium]|nr:hypothetical protein [Clostridia bacterium]